MSIFFSFGIAIAFNWNQVSQWVGSINKYDFGIRDILYIMSPKENSNSDTTNNGRKFETVCDAEIKVERTNERYEKKKLLLVSSKYFRGLHCKWYTLFAAYKQIYTCAHARYKGKKIYTSKLSYFIREECCCCCCCLHCRCRAQSPYLQRHHVDIFECRQPTQ